MSIHFEPLAPADLPLLTRWLQEPHVRAFWDDGKRDGFAVSEHNFGAGRDVPGFIFSVDGQRAGFFQTEQITAGHEFQPWAAPQGESLGHRPAVEAAPHGLGPPHVVLAPDQASCPHAVQAGLIGQVLEFGAAGRPR